MTELTPSERPSGVAELGSAGGETGAAAGATRGGNGGTEATGAGVFDGAAAAGAFAVFAVTGGTTARSDRVTGAGADEDLALKCTELTSASISSILFDKPPRASAPGFAADGGAFGAGTGCVLAAGWAAPDFAGGALVGASPFLLKMENATLFSFWNGLEQLFTLQ